MKKKIDYNDTACTALTIAAVAFGFHTSSFLVFVGVIAFGIFMNNEKKC